MNKFENMAIAMHCNLRPPDAASVLIRFDFVAHGKSEVDKDKDWRGVGRPQVAMHRNCHIL